MQAPSWVLDDQDAFLLDPRFGDVDMLDICQRKPHRMMIQQWAEDLDFIGKEGLETMSCLPVIRRSAKLADNGWKKMQEAPHPFLNKACDARLKFERESIIKEQFAELNQAIIAHCITIPRDETSEFDRLLSTSPFAQFSNQSRMRHSRKTITRDTFAPIVPKLVAKWHTDQRHDALESFLKRFVKNVSRGVDTLDLAHAMFYRSDYLPDEIRMLRCPYFLSSSSFRDHSPGDRERGEFRSSHYATPAGGLFGAIQSQVPGAEPCRDGDQLDARQCHEARPSIRTLRRS